MPRERKVALITGAGSGIGRALAFDAADRGIDTILVGRRQDALDSTRAAIANDTTSITLTGDLTDRCDRQRILVDTGKRFGRLDFLVNNAGIVDVCRFADTDEATLTALFAINVVAPACLIREALPLLRLAGGARIINVGSMFGAIAFPRFTAYSASKHALRGLSDGLRRELKPDGIGLTYAAPRATRTPAARAFEDLAEPMGMAFDKPERVARWIWDGALAGQNHLYPGLRERFAVLLQSFAPGLIDRHLGGIEKHLRDQPRDGARGAVPI